MSPRAKKKPVDRKLAAAHAKVASLSDACAAQQAELEQLRDAVSELTAPKPVRAFRGRTVMHGALDVKLKAHDLSENEVWIEHVGDTLVIVVGAAAEAAHGGVAPRRAREERHAYEPTYSTAQVDLPPAAAVRQQEDLQERELRSVGLPSLAASSPFGGDLQRVMTDDGQLVVNAAVAPQADPRRPGGWQDRSEQAVVAERYGGYTGEGRRPEGWVDPDLAPPS